MKSYILPLVLFACACGLVSCSKDAHSDKRDLPSGSLIPYNNKPIVSKWFSLALAQTGQNEVFCLTGQTGYNLVTEEFPGYDKAHDMVFAYVKVPLSQPGAGIHLLPWSRSFPDEFSPGSVTMDYMMDPAEFVIQVKANGDGVNHPGPALFSNLVYRFLIVPRTVYLSHNIDWSDYDQVAQTLNLQ